VEEWHTQAEHTSTFSHTQPNILIVDDNKDIADTFARIAEARLHAKTRVLYSGHHVLAAVEAERPDMILLDLGMPGIDGYETARRIQEREEYKDIALVAVTGYGQEKDKKKTQAAGFSAHLTKPVNAAALEHALQEALRQKTV